METNGKERFKAESKATQRILAILDELDPETREAVLATANRIHGKKQAAQ